jgi:hypothetical protein
MEMVEAEFSSMQILVLEKYPTENPMSATKNFSHAREENADTKLNKYEHLQKLYLHSAEG